MGLTREQIEFLDKCTRGKWTFNWKTGLVDIEGDFDCGSTILTDFKGVKFGVVTECFYFSRNMLTSLVGAPQEVKGSFYCQNNKLTSLVGAPQKVGRNFNCHYNSLTSLEGAPQKVGRNFNCHYNSLTSLEGAPQEVGGNFSCSDNSLTSLVGAPQWVGGYFGCSNNRLTSLEGAPQKVGGNFFCNNNKLTSLVGAPQKVGGNFSCYGNPISEETLDLVWKTMQEKKVDYWFALSILKSQIESRDWKKMSRGLDGRISKDAQKGISMLGRFGHFD